MCLFLHLLCSSINNDSVSSEADWIYVLLQGWCCSSRYLGFRIRKEWYASWLACAWCPNGWNLDKSLQVDISFRNPFLLLPIDMFWSVFSESEYFSSDSALLGKLCVIIFTLSWENINIQLAFLMPIEILIKSNNCSIKIFCRWEFPNPQTVFNTI